MLRPISEIATHQELSSKNLQFSAESPPLEMFEM